MLNIYDFKTICHDYYDHPNLDKVPDNGIIYVPLEQVNYFFQRICLPNPDKKYIIVSGNSDFGIFYQKEHPVNRDLYKRMDFVNWPQIFHCPEYYDFKIGYACDIENCNINDKYSIKCYAVTCSTFNDVPDNVLHWYAVNLMANHPKISCIPFGVGDQADLTLMNKYKDSKKDKLLYVNFENYTAERGRLKSVFASKSWATVQPQANIPKEKYYEELAKHKYVLSPYGNGVDCFRNYEAFYMKSIPITMRSRWTENMNYLPFMTTNDYDKINPSELEQSWEEIYWQYNYKVDWEPLEINFWKNKIERQWSKLC